MTATQNSVNFLTTSSGDSSSSDFMLASMSEAKLEIGPFEAGSGRIELFSLENVDINVFAGPIKKKTVSTITAINKIEFFVNCPNHFGLVKDFSFVFGKTWYIRCFIEDRGPWTMAHKSHAYLFQGQFYSPGRLLSEKLLWTPYFSYLFLLNSSTSIVKEQKTL